MKPTSLARRFRYAPWIRAAAMKARYTCWVLAGRPIGYPPNSFHKRRRLLDLARRFGCRVLVETGTYLGDTVEATRRHFDRVHSIELDEELYRRAELRFRGCGNVFLHQGDSAEILSDVASRFDERVLFWLDGHDSGVGTASGSSRCPVVGELEAIGALPRKDHCILVDDAQYFGWAEEFPPPDRILGMLRSINGEYHITVQADCFVSVPPPEPSAAR